MDFIKNNNKIRSESSFSDKNLIKTKYIKSYGLSIFNKINDELCVLLVKRKYTYNFFNFVMNNYKFSKKGLVNIFNNISIEEKKKTQFCFGLFGLFFGPDPTFLFSLPPQERSSN